MDPVSRREFITLLGAGVALAAIPTNVFAQAHGAAPAPGTPAAEPIGDFGFDKAPVTVQELGEGIRILQGPGGNITLVNGGNRKFVLIDSGIPPRGPAVLAAVKHITGGIAPETLIDTHWHFDHAGGNETFGKAGTCILAHDNCLERLSTKQRIEFFGLDFPAAPEIALPRQTFSDATTLRMNGQTIHAKYAGPAHTDGDIYLVMERGDVLVTGDLFFNGFFPFIDTSTGGSLAGMISATEKLLRVAGKSTRIVPGHGPVGTRADLQAFHDMLTRARDLLLPLVKKKVPLDEAVTSRPLAELEAKWGHGALHISHFTRIVYPQMYEAA